MFRCRITSVREDASSLTTYLAAEPAPWSDFGGSFDLDYGNLATIPHRPQRRNNWIKGNVVMDKDRHFETMLGHPGAITHLWRDDT